MLLAIEMQKHKNLLLLAYAALAFAILSSNYVCGCIESEKQVLLHFNETRLINHNHNHDAMSSWVGDDCCSWSGIQCNNDGHLIQLDLGGFSLTGLIPEDIGNLTFLTDLTLWSNYFQGLIPYSIGNLASLSTLDLSSNHLNGSLPESLCQLSKLERLDVSSNQLRSIPKCIGGLSNLNYLSLSSNSWEGLISEQHFVNLTSLTSLHISSKSTLVFNVNPNWIPRFQLTVLYMESVNVGPGFPPWLLTQRYIDNMRMPNTSISDTTIPADWFVSLLSSAHVVDLSNNDINMPPPSLIPAPNNMSKLLLSNNHLSSHFPAYICNFTSLSTLLLSNTNISGELPRCLGNLTRLQKLDVMNNSLSGDIPDIFVSLENLWYLNLHNNKFQGKLPLSIKNLTELVVFDVGNNNLRDILPPWTGEQLPNLMFLVLRANHFYGSIPKQFCSYSSIQVLNLAGNHITGNLPPCLNNLTAMTTSKIGNEYYISGFLDDGEMLIDDAKGYELKYTSTLDFLFSIDLSNNNISGEIPEELVDLRNLLNLNLAGNNLSGRIPDRIGKMEQLEYLDLSRNKLHGPIPQSVSDLKHLIRLNLSFNDLSGRIPTGNQLQVLENLTSIYAGNSQLCGRPILKLCAGDPESHEGHHSYKKPGSGSDSDSHSNDERMWFYAGTGPGVLVGFLGFCSSLHFIKSWRHSYFHFVEKVFDKIALFIALSRKRIYN